MGKRRGPRQDGRRAWERLHGWHQDGRGATPGHPDDGDAAVQALTDIGFVRRLLEQAELVAVRPARRHGKSWAEIATQLGVTRQSAWQRWRDLDDADGRPSASPDSRRETTLDVEAAATDSVTRAGREPDTAPDKARQHKPSDPRLPHLVTVPDVIGMSCDDARQVLHSHELVGVGADPDGPPLAAQAWPDGIVTDQSPASGTTVPAGSPVTLWIERGGGSGVREPRRPTPNPRTRHEMNDEPSTEAVA
jgi:hypothetical protein